MIPARAHRDPAAEASARRRAREFRDIAVERARAAGHPALAMSVEAEHARAEGDGNPAPWDPAARLWEARPAR